jgi:[ribosomal protein S5]-alanine N-acetyltransferase
MQKDIEHYFEKQPVLVTERLVLRQITMEDAQAIFDMRANKRVNEFIARPEMNDVAQARDLLTRIKAQYQAKNCLSFAGQLRGDGEIIGTCGFNQFDFPNHHAEIGGEMGAKYWGKGLAQEAFKAIVTFGFEKLMLQTIEAKVLPSNRSAIALLEAYGFVKEAHFKNRILFNGDFMDMAVYTLHKTTFDDNRAL